MTMVMLIFPPEPHQPLQLPWYPEIETFIMFFDVLLGSLLLRQHGRTQSTNKFFELLAGLMLSVEFEGRALRDIVGKWLEYCCAAIGERHQVVTTSVRLFHPSCTSMLLSLSLYLP